MTALVSRFALRGRSMPGADYEALRQNASKTSRRVTMSNGRRWTGGTEIIERPARFAA